MVYFCWNCFNFSSLLMLLQALALSACTTLVSVEPKLTVETRNHVMKVQNFDKLDYVSLTMRILLYNICFEFIIFFDKFGRQRLGSLLCLMIRKMLSIPLLTTLSLSYVQFFSQGILIKRFFAFPDLLIPLKTLMFLHLQQFWLNVLY